MINRDYCTTYRYDENMQRHELPGGCSEDLKVICSAHDIRNRWEEEDNDMDHKKFVLFDAGGVLVYNGIIDDYLRNLPAPYEAAQRAYARLREVFWLGVISIKEFEEAMATELGLPEPVTITPRMEALPWAKRALSVKARGIAILSNHRTEWLLSFMQNLLAEVKGPKEAAQTRVFISDEIHLCKPDPESYRYVLEHLGLQASDVIFLDDKVENCKAAESVGMNAILADNQGVWVELLEVVLDMTAEQPPLLGPGVNSYTIQGEPTGPTLYPQQPERVVVQNRGSIALHQNGFIKAELPGNRRLHVWSRHNPAIPSTTGQGDKLGAQDHNHSFGFDSFILAGGMRNVTLAVVPFNDSRSPSALASKISDAVGFYDEYSVACASAFGPQPKPEPTGRRVRLYETTAQTYMPGEWYSMSPGAFHRTEPVEGFAITIFQKTVQEAHHTTILVPPGQTPVDDFSVLQPPAEALWEAVDRALADVHMAWEDVLAWNEYLTPTLRVKVLGPVHQRRHTESSHRASGSIFCPAQNMAPGAMAGLTSLIKAQNAQRRELDAMCKEEGVADPTGSACGAPWGGPLIEATTEKNSGSQLHPASIDALARLLTMGSEAVQRHAGMRALLRANGYKDLANAMVLEDFAAGRFQPGCPEEADIVACLVPADSLDMLSYVQTRPFAACVVVLSTDSMVEQMMDTVERKDKPPYKVLAVERKDGSGRLGTAGGKIEPGESALDAAIRELWEETGIKLVDARELRFVFLRKDDEGNATACYLLDRRPNLSLGSAWDKVLGGQPTVRQQPGEGALRWCWWDEIIEKTPWPEFYRAARAEIEAIVPHVIPQLSYKRRRVEPTVESIDENPRLKAALEDLAKGAGVAPGELKAAIAAGEAIEEGLVVRRKRQAISDCMDCQKLISDTYYEGIGEEPRCQGHKETEPKAHDAVDRLTDYYDQEQGPRGAFAEDGLGDGGDPK